MINKLGQAKLAFLTQPKSGVVLINYQIDGQEGLQQVEITLDHLRGFIADGAAMAFRARENAA